jgi:hypothetical protein
MRLSFRIRRPERRREGGGKEGRRREGEKEKKREGEKENKKE